jgi:hypothetical protein
VKSFDDYYNEETQELYIESGISRIWKWVDGYPEVNCAIITAFRGSNTKDQNKKNNASLKAKLLKNKYGVTKIIGKFVENYNPEKPDEGTPVIEDSWFVTDLTNWKSVKAAEASKEVTSTPEQRAKSLSDFKQKIIKLAKSYDQDSVIFIEKTNKDGKFLSKPKIVIHGVTGAGWPSAGEEETFKKISISKGQFFSTIKKKAFRFEAVENEEYVDFILEHTPTEIRSIYALAENKK